MRCNWNGTRRIAWIRTEPIVFANQTRSINQYDVVAVVGFVVVAVAAAVGDFVGVFDVDPMVGLLGVRLFWDYFFSFGLEQLPVNMCFEKVFVAERI